MIKPIKIGNVEIDNNIFLAPMAGYTDVAFRSVAKKYGVGLTYTELVSAKAISYGSKATKEMLHLEENDHPCAVQLFGKEPEAFKKAIESGVLDEFDIIDINMGCPAPKVIKNNEGSALLKNIKLAEEIIKTCVNSTTKPVTVKFRSGFTQDEIIAVGFAKMCERAGASAICLHPRTTDQKYAGHSDWSLFGQVKQSVNIPVIASGDIKTIEDLEFLHKIYGVDAYMIGRASLGNPHIFKELQTGEKEYELKQKISDVFEQISIMRKYFDDKYICGNIKGKIVYVLHQKKYIELLQKICRAQSLEEIIEYLNTLIRE